MENGDLPKSACNMSLALCEAIGSHMLKTYYLDMGLVLSLNIKELVIKSSFYVFINRE